MIYEGLSKSNKTTLISSKPVNRSFDPSVCIRNDPCQGPRLHTSYRNCKAFCMATDHESLHVIFASGNSTAHIQLMSNKK